MKTQLNTQTDINHPSPVFNNNLFVEKFFAVKEITNGTDSSNIPMNNAKPAVIKV